MKEKLNPLVEEHRRIISKPKLLYSIEYFVLQNLTKQEK